MGGMGGNSSSSTSALAQRQADMNLVAIEISWINFHLTCGLILTVLVCDLLVVSGPISPPLLRGSSDPAWHFLSYHHGGIKRYVGQDISADDEFRYHLGFLSKIFSS